VTVRLYEGGHMMYIFEPSMIQLRKDLAEFYESALETKSAGEATGG
jgi:carboxypeptidase C (cathepsin A)